MTNFLEIVRKNLDDLNLKYNVSICIKDFVGFTGASPDFAENLQPYLSHECSYCQLVKDNRIGRSRCLSMTKKLMMNCSITRATFFGACHAGMMEAVCPIIADNAVIGSVNVGMFPVKDELSGRIIHRISRLTGIDENSARSAYLSTAFADIHCLDEITPTIELISAYLSAVYLLRKTNPTAFAETEKTDKTIFEAILSYIEANFTNECSLSDIASYCHCSCSYISHLMKKNTGVGVRKYINKLRIEQARILLITTSVSINEISQLLGYSDVSHFTKTFIEFSNQSPIKFRKSNQKI